MTNPEPHARQSSQQGDARRQDTGAQGRLPKLPKPAERAFAQAGYTRLEQLVDVSESDLVAFHGVGPLAVGRLREAMAAAGLSFAED